MCPSPTHAATRVAGLWQEHSDAAVLAAINVAAVRPMLQQASEEVRIGVAGFSPLIERCDYAVEALHLGDGARWTLLRRRATRKDAASVEATAMALLTLGRNFLSQAHTFGDAPPEMQMPIQLAAVLLDQATVETDDRHRVNFQVELDQETAGMTTTVAAMLLPAIQASRDAARRVQGMNNMKQLALAMFNYESVHGHFPPSVLYSDNGTPYSWRVAMLPYLEQQALYDAYNFNEPWDSPGNRRIAETVVPVMKSPNADPASGATNYSSSAGRSEKESGFGTSETGLPTRS